MADSITTFVTFKMPSNAKDMFKEEWLKDFAFMARQPGQKGARSIIAWSATGG